MMFPEDFSRLCGGRIHENVPHIYVLISALRAVGPHAASEALKVKNDQEFKASWPWYVLEKEFQDKSYAREPMWLEVVALCLVAVANHNRCGHRHFEWRNSTKGWVFVEKFDDDEEVHCYVDGPWLFPTVPQWEKALEVHQLGL